jgi:MATE family multidrug resistance protein
MSRRPSSLTEDILCRQYSTFVDPDEDNNDASIHQQQPRVQSALESLSLLDPNDLHDPTTPTTTKAAYGATANNDLLESITIKYENNNDNHSITTETALLRKEIKAMIQLAIPVILTYVLELIPGIITLVLVGRMDNTTISNNNSHSANNNNTATDEHHEQDIKSSSSTKLYVDAAALAVMFFNIIGLSTGQGILTALDTLCASAHGANQSSKMGRYLLTATIIMICMLLLVSLILVNTTPILIALGQPIEVSQQAGIFVYYMLPGLPFLYVYELVRKPSQANHQTLPMICAAIVGLLVTCSTGYYMVNYTSLGWVGAALARTLGYIATVPTVCVGMYITESQFVVDVYNGMIYKEAVTKAHIITFLHIGIPGMIQMMRKSFL